MGATDKAIQTLFKLASEVKTLWENASPESSFPTQDVVTSETDADMMIVDCIRSRTGDGGAAPAIIIGHIGSWATFFIPYASTMAWRDVGWESGTKVTFGDCMRLIRYAEAGSQTKLNDYLIPRAVYGIKLMGGAIRKIRECLKAPLFFRKEVA